MLAASQIETRFVEVRVDADLQILQNSLGAAFVGYQRGPVSIQSSAFTGALTGAKTAAGAFVGVAKNGSLTISNCAVRGLVKGAERTLETPADTPEEYTAMGAFFGKLYTNATISSSTVNCSISDVYVTKDARNYELLVPSAYSGSVGGILDETVRITIDDVNVTAAGIYHTTCGCGSGECAGAKCERYKAYLTQSGAGVENGARFLADHRRFDFNNSELFWAG